MKIYLADSPNTWSYSLRQQSLLSRGARENHEEKIDEHFLLLFPSNFYFYTQIVFLTLSADQIDQLDNNKLDRQLKKHFRTAEAALPATG